MIMELVGTPDNLQKYFEQSFADEHQNFLNNLPHCKGKDLNTMFADKNPVAVDLIKRMLTFDPKDRITVDEALRHEYLNKLHDEEDEPVSEKMCFYDF